MKLQEAIVFVLVRGGHGLTTDKIAEIINANHLYQRKDGNPVTSKQVYAVICRYASLFIKEGGRIRLLM